MLPILFQSLLVAASGLLSVGSITLVILLLTSDRGWTPGLGYALGYTSAYTVIGFSAVLLGYQAQGNNAIEPGLFFPIFLLIFGTFLLALGVRNWRKPISGNQGGQRFANLVDDITPARAFGFGTMVSVVNFKNLALFLTALSFIILSELPMIEKIFITLLVVLVFCLSVLLPVMIYILFPEQAKGILIDIKYSINRHSHTIRIWLPVIFGLLFLIKGITEIL